MVTDIRVENHGTIFLFRSTSDEGSTWLDENIGHAMRLGNAYAVEHNYAWDIAQHAAEDGLQVK